MTVGDKLLDLRKKKGLSQEEVSNILNVSRQTISKWETNQSTPDFDKIKPICELYGISADQLLDNATYDDNLNTNNYEIKDNKDNIKIKNAKNISISVALYILSITSLIFFTISFNNPILGVCIFFIIIAIATGIIVYNSILNSKDKKNIEITKKDKRIKQLNNIISTIIVILYFIISFTTMAFHITWIIFLIGGLINEIVKLIFDLRGDIDE